LPKADQVWQTIEWIAERIDGWIWRQSDFLCLPDIVLGWRAAVPDDASEPYSYTMLFDLDGDPDAPLRVGQGVSVGRGASIELWKHQQDGGVSHVAHSLKTLLGPAMEALDESAEHVLLRLQASHSLNPISTISA
jgi:hypothetical protein